MKICNRCKKEKLKSEFNWKKTNVSLQSMCRSCFKIYRKKIYQNDEGKTKDRVRIYNTNRRLENRKFILEHLLKHPCVDCGESDPTVLEFDHLRDKKAPISKLIRYSRIDKLLEEIEKCEVRCANCHSRKTAKDQSWYKFLHK